MLLEALAEVEANVIATVGRDLDPDGFGSQPGNIRLAKFVSQSLILPHCDAMLARGGYGSLMAALRHGLPVVSLPAAAIDNQRNAARLEALGAGIAIPSPTRTPEGIAGAVKAVLSDRSYRSAAEAVATSIRSLPSTEDAVDMLERLATERTPQVRPG
jgi:UDP:flavonoid glycosyltransferase YjiC (YdhE family)